jgi:hypothetical protein
MNFVGPNRVLTHVYGGQAAPRSPERVCAPPRRGTNPGAALYPLSAP